MRIALICAALAGAPWLLRLEPAAPDPQGLSYSSDIGPTEHRSAWTRLATGSPLRLGRGLFLKAGAASGGSWFLPVLPQSSEAQRMSVLRRPPRGAITLLF